MNNLPTGTVSFLFTDIEGSTRLWQDHPEQMRLALVRHDTVLREAIMSHGGYVFKTIGDACCAAFDRASDAIAAMLASQLALKAQDWPAQTPIRVRMGLHGGVAEERDGDYFGPPLNCASRLMSAAHGGQCLITLTALEMIGDQIPNGVTLRELGLLRLKDLPRPVKAFQLHHPDLPAVFPPLRNLDSAPNNLPQQISSFVGRERELRELQSLLKRQRLVTLTGSAGAGKTRLALEAAAGLTPDFPDGVWLVEMGSLPSPSLLPQALSSVLCVPEEPSRPIERSLADHLRDRRLLIVLDNADSLPTPTAKMLEDLLKGAPELRIIATGRERLHLAGEQVYPVPPLPLPELNPVPSPDDLLNSDCVRLFVDRVRLASPDFELNAANSEPIARLCHRLDGMPLPIELAAAQAHSLPVEQIAERLDDRFRLLAHTASSDTSHQKALGALIDWSYDTLTEKERAVLRRLSVFAGGWTMEAAQAVCSDAKVSTESVSEALDSLVQKQLVLSNEQGDETRYRMLDSLREYAERRLEQSKETVKVRERHQNYFLDLAERAVPFLNSPQQEEWLSQLDREEDNLRTALFWNVTDTRGIVGRLRLAGSLWLFWRLRGHISEGQQWLAQALSTATEAEETTGQSVIGWSAGRKRPPAEPAIARDLIEECQDKLREIGSQPAITGFLSTIGDLGRFKPAATAVRERLDDGIAQIRKIGSQETITGVLESLKKAVLPETAPVQRDVPTNPPREETIQSSLSSIAENLESLAQAAYSQGQIERAARLYGAARALREAYASELAASTAPDLVDFLMQAPDGADIDALAAAWQEGRRMTWQEAIDYALSEK
jgi:predicted ATPase/class 3 adenylate cyclase